MILINKRIRNKTPLTRLILLKLSSKIKSAKLHKISLKNYDKSQYRFKTKYLLRKMKFELYSSMVGNLAGVSNKITKVTRPATTIPI